MATPHGIARLAASCSLLLLPACGDDSTQPVPPPADVSGVYTLHDLARASCDPPDAYDILRATLGDGTPITLIFRVEDLETQVRITPVGGQGPYGPVVFEDYSPKVYPIADDGSVRIEGHRSDVVTLNGRTFFIQMTSASTGRFDRDAEPITLSFRGSSTLVFREDSSDAQVFATCTQTGTTSGSRTGD